MSTSATDHIEVHWRVTGSNTAWSVPKAFALSDEIVVDGLKPDTAYDFEARAVSACGAKSVWVPSGYTTPPVPANNVTLLAVQTQVAQSQADANAANAELANIASDNVLSSAEKPTVIRDYSVITTEQSGIDAQATQYGVTTQKSDYDNAISTLTAYLNGLNTPVPWNNKSGDTTIVGATFQANFNLVYTRRQVLLNAIYQTAKGLADSAQSTASIANTTANTANANTPTVANPQFVLGLAGWSPDGAGWTASSTGSPNPQIPTCALFQNGNANNGLYSNVANPCQAGDRFTATGQIKGVNGTGNAYVGIAWFNISKQLIITSFGNAITGNASGTSRVVGTAPAGAVYCEAVNAVLGYTTGGTGGSYAFTGITLDPQPNTLAETPDGGGRYAATTPNADNTAGAVQPSSWLTDSANLARGGDSITRFGGRTFDNVGDGASRFAVASIDGNRRALVDFSQGAHLNKTQDYIGDGTTYARAKAAALQNGIPLQANTGRNLVVNGSFEAMLSGAAFGDGWTGGGAILGRATGVSGAPSNAALQYNQAPGSVIATGTTFYAINSATNLTGLHVGDTIYLSAQFDNAGGSLPAGITGAVQVAINFINSAGSAISSIGAVSPQTTGWPIATGKGVVPSGTVSAQVQVLIFTNNTTGTAYTVPAGQFPFFGYVDNIAAYAVANADTDVMDGTVHGRIAMQDVFQVGGVNRAGLAYPGSGQTVGDQRNLMPVTWAGVRSVLSASPITFSITSGSPNSTVNFSVAAVSLYAGSVTVSYNASSGSHAQVNGTTATYYLFYRDATGAGGSQTLYITVFPQTLAQYNDAVLIGSCNVTVASGGGGTSGTGSGGGGWGGSGGGGIVP